MFGFWPPLLYFIFILLSTLRLDFWLSLWTGMVAAVQLYVLAAHFHDLNFLTGEANQSPFYHLSRSAVLLMAMSATSRLRPSSATPQRPF